MNISQSTYSNNSRFVSTHKDPLEKYKLGQKEKFKLMYDAIEEQHFVLPFSPQDGTIFLTDQQSMKSFLNSTQKLEEQCVFEEQHISIRKNSFDKCEVQSVRNELSSVMAKKAKHRIFDPLPCPAQLFKSLVTMSITPQHTIHQISEKQCQTSFFERKLASSSRVFDSLTIEVPKPSIGVQVNQSVQQQRLENVSVQYSLKSYRSTSELINLSSYIDRHYDYQQLEPHHNWEPNVSELRLQQSQDDFQYTFCEECHQFIKKFNNSNSRHSQSCNLQVYDCTFPQLVGKFCYLLNVETTHLRDYDQQCKDIRKYCFAAQQICILLQETQQYKRVNQLKIDFEKITKEVQKLKNIHTQKITQLFDKFQNQLNKRAI